MAIFNNKIILSGFQENDNTNLLGFEEAALAMGLRTMKGVVVAVAVAPGLHPIHLLNEKTVKENT